MTKNSTPIQWESLLVRHYLRADGPSGGRPIDYIDATPNELAEALRRHADLSISPAEARHKFVVSFNPDHLRRVLGDGKAGPMTHGIEHLPGYFRHLILTCMIPALEDTDSNQFRMRLGQQILGTHEEFTALECLPKLWETLAGWLEGQRKLGRPYRNLVLPNPGSWTIIGYSLKLSFPSWRDKIALQRLLSGKQFHGPWQLFDLLDHRIEREAGSGSLLTAYNDFRARYHAGQRILGNQRFWVLAQAVAKATGRSEADCAGNVNLEALEFRDGEILFRLRFDGGTDSTTSGPFEGTVSQLGSAKLPYAKAAGRLREHLSRGWIAVEKAGLGIWRTYHPFDPKDRIRLIASGSIKASWQELRTAWSPVGSNWFISGALDPSDPSVRRRLGFSSAASGELAPDISLRDGVKVGNGYLGRVNTLPRIEAYHGADISVAPVDGGDKAPTVERSTSGQVFEICADAPLAGRWRIGVKEVGELKDELTILFEPYARVHAATVSTVLGPADGDVRIKAFRSDSPPQGAELDRPSIDEPSRDPRSVDMDEMIYARGRSPMPEFELLPAMCRIIDAEPVSPWDVLQAYREGGWLDVRTAPGWGARSWHLRAPQLIRIPGSGALVDGALPFRMVERLKACCQSAGADLKERAPVTSWGPVTYLVMPEANVAGIAEMLGWSVGDAGLPQLEQAPGCWPTDTRTTDGRSVGSRWSWHAGQFIPSENLLPVGDEVGLFRWVRERRDDRDIYVVSSSSEADLVTSSRAAAILEAHRRAGRPMFKFQDGRLLRLPRDGHLPVEIARALRLGAGGGSGPTGQDGGHSTYAYGCSSQSLFWLSSTLWEAIVDAPKVARRQTATRQIAARRTPSNRYVRTR